MAADGGRPCREGRGRAETRGGQSARQAANAGARVSAGPPSPGPTDWLLVAVGAGGAGAGCHVGWAGLLRAVAWWVQGNAASALVCGSGAGKAGCGTGRAMRAGVEGRSGGRKTAGNPQRPSTQHATPVGAPARRPNRRQAPWLTRVALRVYICSSRWPHTHGSADRSNCRWGTAQRGAVARRQAIQLRAARSACEHGCCAQARTRRQRQAAGAAGSGSRRWRAPPPPAIDASAPGWRCQKSRQWPSAAPSGQHVVGD